jgi:hypothetical protein
MANGDMVVLNPAEKSYWKMSRPDSTMVPGMAPAVKVERTSTVETILGVRTERAVIDIRVPVPVSPGMAMPGMPTEVAITGEAWLADEYSKYATSASSLGALVGTTGGGSLANLGFPMRSVLRGDVFAGQEIESVVTSISETPAPDGAFDIPAGFTEMPPPRIGLPSLGSGR